MGYLGETAEFDRTIKPSEITSMSTRTCVVGDQKQQKQREVSSRAERGKQKGGSNLSIRYYNFKLGPGSPTSYSSTLDPQTASPRSAT